MTVIPIPLPKAREYEDEVKVEQMMDTPYCNVKKMVMYKVYFARLP